MLNELANVPGLDTLSPYGDGGVPLLPDGEHEITFATVLGGLWADI